MAIIQFLSSLSIRCVLPGVCEAAGLDAGKVGPEFLLFALGNRFRDHSQRLGEALQKSVERSWHALEIALAGDSWWQRVKGTLGNKEDHVFARQLRTFLDAAPMPELTGKNKFRDACHTELKAARKQGLLTKAPEGGDLLARYLDPQSLLAAEAQVLENIAGELQEAQFGNLAYLMSLEARQGQSLVVAAVRYFFRRAVEENPKLFQGLTFSQLDQMQQGQTEAFSGLHEALGQHGSRLEELLGDLQAQLTQTHEAVTQTHDAVLDVQTELSRQGAQNRDLYQAVLSLQQRLDLMHREVRPRDSLSIRSDHERDLVRQVIARYRALPEHDRRERPALLNAVGKLEVAAGEFEAAQEDFAAVATLVRDDHSRGEAHQNAHRAALERRDWDAALRELIEAVRIDGKRFAPFPVGKYHPKRILGAGGFGIAFLCHHKQLDAEVVVKTLVHDDLERDVDQVFTEAKALWQLDHPAIIRLLDCGYTFPNAKGRPYFVMHYFDGITLEDHVQRHGPLAVEDMAEVVRQMAEGLKAAHGKGILHRDVKPANVMVRKEDATWQVKLIDFGLALSQKAITNAATVQQARTLSAASIAGTMEYAAPEQMGKLPGVKVGAPADVYGLARTCCHALFESAEPTFQDWQRLPRGWAELLGDCLNRNPEKRPASMAVFLDRLKALQASPVPVLRPGPVSDEVPVLSPIVPILTPTPGMKLPAFILEEQKKHRLPPPPPGQEDIGDRVLAILTRLTTGLASGAIYLHPAIPEKKLANARASCMVPGGERVLAVVDCTVFGSASDAIVFGASAVYYHHSGGNVPDPGHVAYSEFPGISFTTAWLNCVMMGGERYVNRAGATLGRDKLIEIFNAIKELVESKAPAEVLPLTPGHALPPPDRIVEILRPQAAGESGFYLSPGIPPKKVANAIKGCGVPGDEKVLGLIDCTVFGSASDALVFGARGFYYHNIGGNVPDPGNIPYEEFPEITFGTAWVNCVTLGRDRYCNKSGNSIGRDKILAILNAIKAEMSKR